ncbi:hypothetical protein EAI_01926 [Harpegnathos saltator]|uniref:Uncharacterized protein n=1 Tax=Harpegnathos saltator TaxID=610380 RepID=E2BNI8_HARSA|nr:hypothetical protein EAI_01926 [Harpegnathos saltator]
MQIYFLSHSLFERLIQTLYTNGTITFSTLLSLVTLASAGMLHYINIIDLPDSSHCSRYVKEACKKIEILRALFVALDVKLNGIHLDEQRISRRVGNIPICLDTDNTFIVNKDILLESPKIIFDLNQHVDDNHFHQTLCPSPIKDKNKQLFSKYNKRKYCPPKWSTASPAFSSSSWNNMSGWLSPRGYSFKGEPVTPDGKSTLPLYSGPLHNPKPTPERLTGLLQFSMS